MSVFTTLRRNKWKTIAGIIVLVLLGLGVRAITAPKVTEYVTADVTRGNLTQTVEAVGTVTSDRDLDLQFKTPGIVSQVYVKSGQKVRAGQTLASLKAGSLAAGIASASASVREAQANLQALREGSRPEDIAVSQATVANKRASLEAAQATYDNAKTSLQSAQDQLAALKAESDTNLQGQVSLALSAVNEKLATAQSGLQEVGNVFANNDLQDALTSNNAGSWPGLHAQQQAALQAIADLQKRPVPTDYQGALQSLAIVRTTMNQAVDVINSAYNLVASLQVTNYMTIDRKQGYLADLSSQKSAVLGAISAIDSSANALQNATASYDTKITSQESAITSAQGAMDKAAADISTFQTSLGIDEAQLNLKQAGARQTDLDAAQARVRAAQAMLASASSNYTDTLLIAPVDGVVTNVNVKLGEATPVGSAVTVLGNAPYRIEMYVSEVDVPKVTLSQTGSIELDAFKGTPYQLHVSEIASAPTDVSGVSKYKVMLDFAYHHDEIKIGMTGDATITSGSRNDVLHVPLRSVLQDADGQKLVRVVKSDGTPEDRYVKTGLEGGDGDIEITDGLKEGEKVVVLVKK